MAAEPYNGRQLRTLGLKVMTVEAAGVLLAASYRIREQKISFNDSMALALAKVTTSILLTGDASLRALAGQETVECHGLLWPLNGLDNSCARPGRTIARRRS